MFEIVPRIFLLGLQEHVAIGDLVGAVAAVEVEIVDAVDALHIHRQALEAVGELARHRRAFEARDLLEVGELADFHAVAPAFPAEAPRAQRRALPVVLDKADVVQRRIDADGVQRLADRGPAGSAATASGSPGTDNSAAAGSGSRRSGRPSAGARAAHRPRSRASARARAASSPDGRCRRPFPCRRAAGSRSPGRPEPLQREDEALERTFRAHMGRTEASIGRNRSREGDLRRAGPYRAAGSRGSRRCGSPPRPCHGP